MKDKFFLNLRVLFTVNGCEHCLEWMKIVESINFLLPLEKRIKVVDCSKYYEMGIIEDHLFKIFKKEINGSFPILFFDGMKLAGSRPSYELEAFLRTLLQKEFIFIEQNDFYFDKDCRIEKKGVFKNKLICE